MEPCDCIILKIIYTCYKDFHLWKIILLELPLQQTNLQPITNKLKDQESLFILKESENIMHCTPFSIMVENK